MKKIWIDGFEANVPQRLGSSQVAFELLRNIEKIDHENDYTILLSSPPLENLPKEREKFRYQIIKPNQFKTLVGLPLAILKAKNKPDVFFSPTHYIPRFTTVKRVVSIFDLAYLHFPQFYKKRDVMQLERWTKYSLKNASHIVTISNATKKDIIKTYNIDPKKITVSYPGFDDNIYKPISDQAKIKSIQEKYKIDAPYILFLGTVQPKKNLKILIEAFQKIDHVKLVVIGKTTGLGRQAWMFEEILGLPKKLGIEEKVIFTGFVPTEEVSYLMNGAEGFILPSFYEGFGITAVEAMACGVPVIVSNTASLPEVVGDAGLQVDPNSVDQIEHAIRLITTDKKMHDKLSKKSLERAKKFSWKKMAKDVTKVLESL